LKPPLPPTAAAMFASRDTLILRFSSQPASAPANAAIFSFSILATMPTFLIFILKSSQGRRFVT
jgi:hypothetical protein